MSLFKVSKPKTTLLNNRKRCRDFVNLTHNLNQRIRVFDCSIFKPKIYHFNRTLGNFSYYTVWHVGDTLDDCCGSAKQKDFFFLFHFFNCF